MIDNFAKILPPVWARLSESDIIFHNSSPSVIIGELMTEFPQFEPIISNRFRGYFLQHKEIYCVVSSLSQRDKIHDMLIDLGFKNHYCNTFLFTQEHDNHDLSIYHYPLEELTVVVVVEDIKDSTDFGQFDFVVKRMFAQIKSNLKAILVYSELHQYGPDKFSNQVITLEWYASMARMEYIRAIMEWKDLHKVEVPKTTKKSGQRSHTTKAQKPYMKA